MSLRAATWHSYRDGVRRTEVRVLFPLSLDELAAALAHWCDTQDVDPGSLSRTRIREVIRDHLYAHGMQNVQDGDPDDAHHDAVRRSFIIDSGEEAS